MWVGNRELRSFHITVVILKNKTKMNFFYSRTKITDARFSVASRLAWSGARQHCLVAVVAGTALVLGACGGGDDAPAPSSSAESSNLLVRDGAFDPKLKGAWRVLGEGRFFEIGDHEIRQFQETNSICYPDARFTFPADRLKGYTFRQVSESGHVTVDISETQGAPSVNTLERLPRIPEDCRKQPPSDPATVFKTMWEIFNLDYGSFKERNIDWAARLSSLQPRAAAARDDDALQTVLVEALQDFNDYHVSLSRFNGEAPTFEMQTGNTPTRKLLRQAFTQQSDVATLDEFELQWKARMRASVSRLLVPGSEHRVLNGAMVWGMLPGNIGYIQLSAEESLAGDQNAAIDIAAAKSEMDRVVEALGDTHAIIFDVAVNDGGFDEVSAAVAGHFADRRRLAFTVQQRRPQGRKEQEHFVEPANYRYLKPVYLLTTDRTVSAGETLTLMMRELPNVTHVGQPTSGSMGTKLEKSLPGNFAVTLSSEILLDSKGVKYEGRGVPPKVALQVFQPSDASSLYTGHEIAIRKIMDMIGR